QFRPTDLEVDDTANLYVLDGVGKRVLKWAPNATTGTMAADGVNGPPNSQFKPTSLAFNYDWEFYIGDDDSNRVLSWVPGATTGTTYAGGNGTGNGPDQFDNLNGICFDTAGNLYVADAWNWRLQRWAPGATSGTTINDTLFGNIQYVDADLDG